MCQQPPPWSLRGAVWCCAEAPTRSKDTITSASTSTMSYYNILPHDTIL